MVMVVNNISVISWWLKIFHLGAHTKKNMSTSCYIIITRWFFIE